MERTYSSIFNDVLGPIMTGPSSSHSAGCARIGRTARFLFGREITRADIVFEEQGSYPSTFVGQGSDFGFVGGMLGYPPDDHRLRDAIEIAKKEGKTFRFKKAPLGFHHPNEARIDVYSAAGEVEMSLMTYSVGGGMFQIKQMDEFPVCLDGSTKKVFICCTTQAADRIRQRLADEEHLELVRADGGERVLFSADVDQQRDCTFLKTLREQPGVYYVRFADPVMPVVKKKEGNPAFFNAEEAMAYQRETGKEMWELAVDYECSFGDVTPEQVLAMACRTMEVMRAASCPPDPETTKRYGIIQYACKDMQEQAMKTRLVNTGVLQSAMFAAIADMENNSAHHIVAAAPTAGSSGVLPSAIVAVGSEMGLSDEEIEKGLLAAGLVGAFIANQATFGAEVAACQAENGAASCMAAAGVVQMLGGSVEAGFRAASLALQNLLGLICDPVAGLAEMPCISRNVASAANSVLSANMAVLGFDPIIPLDETILAMKRVGAELPASLRCTCKGGLCVTPTGCRIGCEMEARRPVL